ncbi:MAG: hypothetical protein PHW63_09355, partial [Alphaproteobacteria bacterium]|nr:hypothetical protein [Alphaproteobacteria bacterium]
MTCLMPVKVIPSLMLLDMIPPMRVPMGPKILADRPAMAEPALPRAPPREVVKEDDQFFMVALDMRDQLA